MTREEAIMWLIKPAITSKAKELEAYDMAIEALQDKTTGEWIHEKMPVPPYYFTPSCHCNQCGVFVVQESNYCPNCGADMRGGEE